MGNALKGSFDADLIKLTVEGTTPVQLLRMIKMGIETENYEPTLAILNKAIEHLEEYERDSFMRIEHDN
jgi:hypothetical protein